jgi:protein-disulfide isomerase
LLLALAACRSRVPEPPDPEAPSGAPAPGTSDKGDAVLQIDGRDEIPVAPEQLAAGIPHLRFVVPVGDAPSRGPADAPVTIVMFADFECPYCETADETIAQLEAEYPGQIRFVYKAFPIDGHPTALLAAMVAHAAHQQGRFWEFYGHLYSGRPLDPDTLVEYAGDVGLDLARLKAEIAAFTHASAVRADMRLARRLDVTSTPTFFVNGRHIRGAKPIQFFRWLVDQELSLARRWKDDGVKPGAIYDHATRHGYAAVAYEGDENRLDEDAVYAVPLGDSPTRGPATARFTVVVFADFQCPYCARGNATMESLRKQYGDDMRIVFKHFVLPHHAEGARAARGAEFARSHGRFWEFHDAVFAAGARFDRDALIEIARDVGLPEAAFTAAIDGTAFDARIEADLELGHALGVDGTPAFFVNGRPISGARPEMDFHMLFAEERERAAKLLDRGVAPAGLYDALVGG